MVIPDETIEEIRLRCDIVEVVGSYIPLRQAGGGSWKACCPFHQEKTPSFHVRSDKQVFHCFGCGKGGDVFRFVMEREGVSFPEAVRLLASRCGVIIPETTSSGDGRRDAGAAANTRDRLYQLQEEFARFFERNLKNSPGAPASRYLQARLIPPEVAARFRLGAAPDTWDGCLRHGRALGFSDDEMIAGGIVRRTDAGRLYDFFRGRLTFAIWNEQGKVVGFSARSLEEHPQTAKYVNTAETAIFKKGRLLYALPLARKPMQDARECILCEGQLDTIAMHRAGFEQTVAPQGTGFTADQAGILRRYVNRVSLAFDADQAGQKAVLGALALLLPLEFDVKIIRIQGGKDPDELLRDGGAEAVRSAVESAVPWTGYLAKSCAERYNLSSAAERGRAAGEFIELLRTVENPVLREFYSKDVAVLLNVSQDSILGELKRRRRYVSRSARSGGGTSGSDAACRSETSGAAAGREQAELTLLEIALKYEHVARRLAELLPPERLGKSLSAQALNAVLADTMNGEHSHASVAVASMLSGSPAPDISRILVSDCTVGEEDVDKAVSDCVAVLQSCDEAARITSITEEMRKAGDHDERMRLLSLMTRRGDRE